MGRKYFNGCAKEKRINSQMAQKKIRRTKIQKK